MLDTEYHFDEVPLRLGSCDIAYCSGSALLEWDECDCNDSFSVTGIALDATLAGDYRDKRIVRISNRSDDPLGQLLFERLLSAIENDPDAVDHIASSRRDHQSFQI